MSRSASFRRGPVWYHPMMRSRATTGARRKVASSVDGPAWCKRKPEAQSAATRHSMIIHPAAGALTVDLFEHGKHVLQVAVVEEPDGGVPVILLKWHCSHTPIAQVTIKSNTLVPRADPPLIATVQRPSIGRTPRESRPPPPRPRTRKTVGDVHAALVRFPEQQADHPFPGVPRRRAVVVVDHAEQHQRVHDNDPKLLLRRRHCCSGRAGPLLCLPSCSRREMIAL